MAHAHAGDHSHAGHSHAGHSHAGHGHAGHDHAGHAHGGRGANRRRLLVVLVLTAIYTVAEAVGGYMAHSLALVADAAHMLSDVAALGLSLFAARAAERPPTPERSYGYYRTEILAALVNAATLIAISLFVFVEAARRLREPPPVAGGLVMAIAAGGFVMNVIGMVVLNGGKASSLNVRGAWLHVATDALGNLGTVLAGGLVLWLGWTWADPVASVLIGALVIWSSWALMRESVAVLMEGTPRGMDPDAIRSALAGVPGVCAVHDLHVWSITTGLDALSAHLSLDGSRPDREVLRGATQVLHDRFRIDHTTLQLEEECAGGDALHP